MRQGSAGYYFVTLAFILLCVHALARYRPEPAVATTVYQRVMS